jgi:hypothetical protein
MMMMEDARTDAKSKRKFPHMSAILVSPSSMSAENLKYYNKSFLWFKNKTRFVNSARNSNFTLLNAFENN